MAKYRRQTEIVEAIQFTNETKDQCFNFMTGNRYASFDENATPELVFQAHDGTEERIVFTNWIIKDSEGNFHIRIADEFDNEYTPVVEEE